MTLLPLNWQCATVDLEIYRAAQATISQLPTSRVGDVTLLTDEELDEMIQKERAARAESDGRDDDEEASILS